MDVIKILLTLIDSVTPMLRTTYIKRSFTSMFARFTTTDSQMTDFLTLRELSDLPTLNGLVS